MNMLYEIEGTKNRDQNPVYDNPNFTTFQAHLVQFKWLLKDLVKKGESKTFYKFGDGDYFFLRGESVGSASPGKRALSKSYSDIKHEEFVSGVCENDYVNVELYNRDLFNSLYPNRQINFNAEYGYGLVANRWLTETFSESIGVIGASQKVKLIEKLMEKKEYQAGDCWSR